MKEFTTEKGIAVQNNDLARWKTKLKSEVYNDLVEYAQATNQRCTNGYQIRRGSDLTTFISNWQPNK